MAGRGRGGGQFFKILQGLSMWVQGTYKETRCDETRNIDETIPIDKSECEKRWRLCVAMGSGFPLWFKFAVQTDEVSGQRDKGDERAKASHACVVVQ